MSETLAPPLPGASLLRSVIPETGFVRRRDETSSAQSPVSLEALIHRLQRRDDTALEEFIATTQDMAYRLAYSILPDHQRCQDVLQEVYLTVYQKIDQLQNPAAMRGWFCQIVVNRCRQELKGRRLESLDELPFEPGVHGMAESVHQKLDVASALHKLPTLDRAVLTMREVMQLSYQEIADNLKVPLGTVRSRIFNARQRFLEALSPQKRSNP